MAGLGISGKLLGSIITEQVSENICFVHESERF
jgi:hypothetical protein